jgi:uncharacterized protein (UPF0333 family)
MKDNFATIFRNKQQVKLETARIRGVYIFVLPFVGFFLSLQFNSEDGGYMFLLNANSISVNYTTLYQRRQKTLVNYTKLYQRRQKSS